MPSSYFARGGAPDENDFTYDSPMPSASFGSLKHARSTSALQVITPIYQRGSPISPASDVSRSTLSPISPSPSPAGPGNSIITPSPIDSSLPSPAFSSVIAHKYSSAVTSPAPDIDTSFAQKIRFRLSSVTRKPVALPLPQISYPFRTDDSKKLELEGKACVTRQVRSMSTSTTGVNGARSNMNGRTTPKLFLDQAKQAAANKGNNNLDMKSSKSGKTFFQGGLAKAHKKIFGRSNRNQEEEEEEEQDTSDSDEEDVNLIYSNGMVPLEFPTEAEEGNGFIIVSPVEKDFRHDLSFGIAQPDSNSNSNSTPRKKFTSLPAPYSTPLPNRRVPLPSIPCSSSTPKISS